jgi:hypothetical protein
MNSGLPAAADGAEPGPRRRSASVASRTRRAYHGPMLARRLFQSLMMAALLLMPFGMIGGMATAHALPVATTVATMDHCGGADKAPQHHSSSNIDCMAACAAIPATGDGDIAAPIPFPAVVDPSPDASLGKGLGPEAAIPPPRIS